MQLMARFYDPQQGRIAIDGMDVRDVTLRSLRGEIGFVFQETFLFSDTVANNIRYGHPEATMGDVEAAARDALAGRMSSSWSCHGGIDTMLGERGAMLSGAYERIQFEQREAVTARGAALVMRDVARTRATRTRAASVWASRVFAVIMFLAVIAALLILLRGH